MSTPTFVVGTGRCGSTMLSNMLREHPKVLSLSEFFISVTDGARTPQAVEQAFPRHAIDGPAFWRIVAGPSPYFNFQLRNGVPNPELIYPWQASTARFSLKTGIPAISLMTLPHLTEDCDGLFEILRDEVETWPSASIERHYRQLFGWLASHFGKALWIERSAGGLGMAQQLLTSFPDARIVHLARDGRDASLSMFVHMGFRHGVATIMLGQHLGVDPIVSTDRTRIDSVPAELRPFLPEEFDVARLDKFEVSPPLCGQFWTQQVESGLKILATLPADRLLMLRYEDFFTDPKRQLDTFTAFLGEDYVDEDWSFRCAATVRPPRSTWRDLPADEARALTEACRPGFEQLRAVGIDYEI